MLATPRSVGDGMHGLVIRMPDMEASGTDRGRGEPVDFVAHFAYLLPVIVICDLVGIPPSPATPQVSPPRPHLHLAALLPPRLLPAPRGPPLGRDMARDHEYGQMTAIRIVCRGRTWMDCGSEHGIGVLVPSLLTSEIAGVRPETL
jgi:cytochrome P450